MPLYHYTQSKLILYDENVAVDRECGGGGEGDGKQLREDYNIIVNRLKSRITIRYVCVCITNVMYVASINFSFSTFFFSSHPHCYIVYLTNSKTESYMFYVREQPMRF